METIPSNPSIGPCGKFRFKVEPFLHLGLIHLNRKRPWPSCINPETGNEWSNDVKNKILEVLNNTGLEIFQADVLVTVDDDPSLRRALAACVQAEVDVIVAVQPTISDGRLAPVLAQEWGEALVFWATPEQQVGEMISGNSLVGSHLMTATIRQLGRKCQFVYGNMDWVRAETRLRLSVNVAFASRYIKHTKLALIGHQAPGFVDFHPDPFLLSRTFGTILQHVSLTEYLDIAKNQLTDAEISADVDDVTSGLHLPFKDQTLSKADLPIASRHYLAMKRLVVANNFDGLAIRCWPELPGSYEGSGLSQWCYMALARLATEGFPIACEGDVDGAFGCLVGKLTGCGAIYLSDWLEHDKTTLTLWHGGMAPFQLSEAVGTPLGPCISRHFNNRAPGCLDATIKIGIPVTVYRFWVLNGQYHLVVLEGDTVAPRRHLLGNNGLVEFGEDVDLLGDFEKWVGLGFPHHVCVVEGRHGDTLRKFALDHGVNIIN